MRPHLQILNFKKLRTYLIAKALDSISATKKKGGKGRERKKGRKKGKKRGEKRREERIKSVV